MSQTSRSSLQRWAFAAMILSLGVACASRPPGAATTTTATAAAPVDLDGSLLSDPAIQAPMPRACPPPSVPGECSDGCRWVANACRRVQGLIPQPEAAGDGGAALIGQPQRS